MAKIITFINEKGGVGKTSTCFNSAWELATTGKRVLCVDLDGQNANLTFFAGINKDSPLVGMIDVLKNGVSIKKAIVGVRPGLDIVPAGAEVVNLDMTAKLTRFKKATADVADDYDYVFIDVPPQPGWGHYLSLSVSDYAVIVMLPDIASLEGNKGVIDSIEEIQATSNDKLKILGFLFNKNESRTRLSQQVAQAAEGMATHFKTRIFDTKIRNTVVLGENLVSHKGVTEYAPKSPAADDVRDFVAELVKGAK